MIICGKPALRVIEAQKALSQIFIENYEQNVKLLQRYFWKQALWPLLLSLSALAVLALLTQSLQTLDLIVENRQSAATFLFITLLALPQLIGIILPLALFMAVLYALNRLNVDSEIVVAKAAGFSPWQIASPVLKLTALVMVAHLVINLIVQPLSFRKMRAEVLKVRTDVASQLLNPGTFVKVTDRLTIYAREITPGGAMSDVLIYDNSNPEAPSTHTAKTGQLTRGKTSVSFSLDEGNVQTLLPNGNLDFVSFETYHIDLTQIIALEASLKFKSSDKFLGELLSPSLEDVPDTGQRLELRAEGHNRLATPLYSLALSLLALCFMIRGQHRRMGYGRLIAICGALGFTIRLFDFALVSAAMKNPGLNYWQYGLPLLISLFCLLFLLQRKRVRSLKSRLALAPRAEPN